MEQVAIWNTISRIKPQEITAHLHNYFVGFEVVGRLTVPKSCGCLKLVLSLSHSTLNESLGRAARIRWLTHQSGDQ